MEIEADELSQREIAFLPDIIDSETLYSWTGHYHRLSGNASPKDTSRKLFGDERAGLRTEFPSQLDYVASVTNCVFGDAETLAYRHTLFGFCAPFQTEASVMKALEGMKGNGVKSIKAMLGLQGKGFSAFQHLKACPDCMMEDMKKYSLTKWHVEHQWPAAWVCRKHGALLRVVKQEVLNHGPKQFLLPQDIYKRQFESISEKSSEQIEVLRKVVDFCASLARRRNHYLNPELLRHTYVLGAKKYDWINMDGTLKQIDLWIAFRNYYRGLEDLHEFGHIELSGAGRQFVVRQFQNLDLGTHPIRHVLLMAFIFDSTGEFESTYEQVCSKFRNCERSIVYELADLNLRPELRKSNKKENILVKNVSIALGTSHKHARRVYKIHGAVRCSRFVMNSERWHRFRQQIFDGIDLREVGRQTGHSVSYLRRYLSENPDLAI